jgi:hypothetical protein
MVGYFVAGIGMRRCKNVYISKSLTRQGILILLALAAENGHFHIPNSINYEGNREL